MFVFRVQWQKFLKRKKIRGYLHPCFSFGDTQDRVIPVNTPKLFTRKPNNPFTLVSRPISLCQTMLPLLNRCYYKKVFTTTLILFSRYYYCFINVLQYLHRTITFMDRLRQILMCLTLGKSSQTKFCHQKTWEKYKH